MSAARKDRGAVTLSDFEFLVLGCFHAELGVVRDAIDSVIGKYAGTYRLTSEQRLDLSRAYEVRPTPGGAHPVTAVLFEPKPAPQTTAFVANLEDGWMTMFNVLCGRLPGRHIQLRSSIEAEYPIHEFQVWVDGQSTRYVRAMRDDPSWEFFVQGEPLEFEDVHNYQQRRISQRLTRSILVTYLGRLGWELARPDFFTTNIAALYLAEQRPRSARAS